MHLSGQAPHCAGSEIGEHAMPKSKATSKADTKISPLAITRPLTLGEKVALAAASLAIKRLPGCLQQSSNAYDMQAMLIDPASVWRGAYILAQARSIFGSFSGWRPDAIEDGVDLHPKHREDFESFIQEAIKAHEAEIAEDEAWEASPEGIAFTADFEARQKALKAQQAAE